MNEREADVLRRIREGNLPRCIDELAVDVDGNIVVYERSESGVWSVAHRRPSYGATGAKYEALARSLREAGA